MNCSLSLSFDNRAFSSGDGCQTLASVFRPLGSSLQRHSGSGRVRGARDQRCSSSFHHHSSRRTSRCGVRSRLDTASVQCHWSILSVRCEHASVVASALELARLRRRHAVDEQRPLAIVECRQCPRSVQSAGHRVLLLAGLSKHSNGRSHSRRNGTER